jgi:hypothetical protein
LDQRHGFVAQLTMAGTRGTGMMKLSKRCSAIHGQAAVKKSSACAGFGAASSAMVQQVVETR